jgi:hypothetical protein
MSADGTNNLLAPATTIDEVIARLDAIIVSAQRNRNREGYFAALYKRVTVRVRDGIARGEFQDGARMTTLDVTFANRYLHAQASHAIAAPTTGVWDVAFAAAARWQPLVLQPRRAHGHGEAGDGSHLACAAPDRSSSQPRRRRHHRLQHECGARRRLELGEQLAPLAEQEQAALIASTDIVASALSSIIEKPGPLLRTVLLLIRLGERGSIPEIIARLNR